MGSPARLHRGSASWSKSRVVQLEAEQCYRVHARRDLSPPAGWRPDESRALAALKKRRCPAFQLSELNAAGRLSLCERLEGEVYLPSPGVDAFVSLVLAREGILPALELATHLPRFKDVWGWPAPGLHPIRNALACADDDERAKAEAWLEDRSGTNDEKVHRSYLLPEQSTWREEAVATRLGQTLLMIDAALESQRAEQVPSEPGTAETLGLRFGSAALELMKIWWKRARGEAVAAIAAGLAVIDEDEAVQLLGASADRKAVIALLPEMFSRFPERCIRVGLFEPKLDAAVRGWVQQRPELAAAIVEAQPRLRTSLERIQSALGAGREEVGVESLPEGLGRPPWRSKRRKLPLIELEPQLPPDAFELPEAMVSEVDALLAECDGLAADERGFQFGVAGVLSELGRLEGADRQARAAEGIGDHYGERSEFIALGGALGARFPEVAPTLLRACKRPEVGLGLVGLRTRAMAEAVLPMVGLRNSREVALQWIQGNADYAALAWIPAALGADKKLKPLAVAGLNLLASHGGSEALETASEAYGVEATLDQLLADWPHRPINADFVRLDALPRPRLSDGGAVLDLEALERVVEGLAASRRHEVHPGIEALRGTCERSSLDAFAFGLFRQWLESGAPSKQAFAMQALGWLGDDATVDRLVPMLEAWPKESHWRRAVSGLDVLVDIGSDYALSRLDWISRKVKNRSVRTAAAQRIEELAESRGLSREALADRLVPTLGLDPRGTVVLDFGPRQFVVGFDEVLKPFVKDEGGKRLRSLPRPGAKDDAEKAPMAAERFKLLKKEVRTQSNLQPRRLQRAMIVGRRWSFDDFERLLLRHPLMQHLARRLVWGSYRGQGLVGSFRISEEGSFADVKDDAFEPSRDLEVGLVHPIDLEVSQRSSWGELFGDYEILQPFSQVGRSVHRLEADTDYIRPEGALEVPARGLLGLAPRGWDHPEASSGVVSEMSLPLDDGLHRLELHLRRGYWLHEIHDAVAEVDGIRLAGPGGAVRFGLFPARLASEALEALAYLRSAGAR